ncbi:unnamed protein product [Laminaria digitata]
MLDLMNDGRVLTAVVYALISVVVGLVCVWSGHSVGLSLGSSG